MKGFTMRQKIKFIAEARRWRDKINGNTYHSCRIIRTSDGHWISCKWQYGGGEQYKYTALNAMAGVGWLPKKYCQKSPNGGLEVWKYERENNYPIAWIVSDGKKRDMVALGNCGNSGVQGAKQ